MPKYPEIFPVEDEKYEIEGFLTLGDSLSDRGSLKKRKLFGIIPMDFLAGLSGRSPKGRFTNGFTWDDHLAAMVASELDRQAIQRQEHRLERDERMDDDLADEADDIISHQNRTEQTLRQHAYTLDDDLHVHYHGENLLDSYNEGGLTSYPYNHASEGTMGFNLSRFFSREILSNLTAKRKKALDYAERHKISFDRRGKTLVMEWSGANDLITVNAFPTPDEVTKAVDARIQNVIEMANAGYRRFMLMDMPDLSKTPRYQNQLPETLRGLDIDFYKSLREADLINSTTETIQGIAFTKLRDGRYLLSTKELEKFQKLPGGLEVSNAQLAAKEFNRILREKCQAAESLLHTACQNEPHSFDIFPVSDLFDDVYLHPQKYRFDKAKIHEPYTKSADYRRKGSQHIKDAHGHMFWDDIHPSAHMHKLLAEIVYAFISKKYHFIEPISKKKEAHQASLNTLVSEFHKQYKARCEKDTKKAVFPSFLKFKLVINEDNPEADLKNILKHALFEGGDRTWHLIKGIGWFGDTGQAFDRSDIKCGRVHSSSLIIEKALHDVVNERHAEICQPHHRASPKLH